MSDTHRNYVEVLDSTEDGLPRVAIRSESERDMHGVIENPVEHIHEIANIANLNVTITDMVSGNTTSRGPQHHGHEQVESTAEEVDE